MRFSVCIPTTRATTIKAAITSIFRQTYTDWELVVVGQGKETANIELLVMSLAPKDACVRYIHLQGYGAARARNAAMQAATGDIIALMDDDCEARADWLEVLAGCFEAEPEVEVVGGALVAPKPARRGFATCPALIPAEALYDPISSGRHPPKGWDWLTANVALRRNLLERVGLLDEYLGTGAVFPAGEDTDYKLRMEAMGIKVRSTPRAVVYHTYGYRYGWRAVLRHGRSYAQGNGALAGKQTLSGDPRGEEWVEITKRECTSALFKQLLSGKLPARLLRLFYFTQAYKKCVREYRVDPISGMLYLVRHGQPDALLEGNPV